MTVLRPSETSQVITRTITPVARLVTARLARPSLTPRVVANPDTLAVAAPTTVLTPRPGTLSAPAGGTGGGTVIGGAIRFVMREPAATWSWTLGLGRVPQVEVWVADPDTGQLELVDADVVATATAVVVTFSRPVAGELIVR